MSNRVFMSTRLGWRHTFVQPKMGPLDYRAVFIIFPFLFYIRLSTLGILAFILIVMWALQQRKIEPDNILRWLRAEVAGRERTSQGVRRRRPPVDYAFETPAMIAAEKRRQQNILDYRKSKKYKGRDFGNRGALGPSQLKPLRERFTKTRSG